MLGEDKTFRFSFPSDHPRAAEVANLMKRLQTSMQTRSGLVVNYRERDDSAVEEALDAIRDLFASEGLDTAPIDVLRRACLPCDPHSREAAMRRLVQTQDLRVGHDIIGRFLQ